VSLRILEGDSRTPIPEVEEVEIAEPAPRKVFRGPRADGMRAGSEQTAARGEGVQVSSTPVAVVPDLLGRVEGDARRLLERAGFTLGDILFRESDERTGTVLETFPVPGERVQLPATVNLILADRRRSINPMTIDTMPADTMRVDTISIDTTRVDTTRSDSTRIDTLRSDTLP
jgi:beta-lactam-binding protein with PASTA domain